MPRRNGVEATRRIRTEYPGPQVAVLTSFADDDSLFPALQAGARGYLTKDAGGDEIVRAIQAVLSGEAGLSPATERRPCAMRMFVVSHTHPGHPSPEEVKSGE